MAEYSLSKLACFTLHKSSCNWASFLLTSFGAYTWTHTALWPQQSWQSAPSSPLVKFQRQLKFGGKEVDGLSGCWQPLCVAFFLYTVSSLFAHSVNKQEQESKSRNLGESNFKQEGAWWESGPIFLSEIAWRAAWRRYLGWVLQGCLADKANAVTELDVSTDPIKKGTKREELDMSLKEPGLQKSDSRIA